MDYEIGFDDFKARISLIYAPVLAVTQKSFALSGGILKPLPSNPYISLLRSMCLTIMNSCHSTLLLTMNGCASDALKVVRGMFESSVVVAYLLKHPGLFNDFIDYRWIKRYNFQSDMAKFAPAQFNALDPSDVAETLSEYARVKDHFKDRRSWSGKGLRGMAKDVGVEQSFFAIYPLTSSVHHLDVIGIMAQEDEHIFDVEEVPSENNIEMALSISGLSVYLALSSFDEVARCGIEVALRNWFQEYGSALKQVASAKPASS